MDMGEGGEGYVVYVQTYWHSQTPNVGFIKAADNA